MAVVLGRTVRARKEKKAGCDSLAAPRIALGTRRDYRGSRPSRWPAAGGRRRCRGRERCQRLSSAAPDSCFSPGHRPDGTTPSFFRSDRCSCATWVQARKSSQYTSGPTGPQPTQEGYEHRLVQHQREVPPQTKPRFPLIVRRRLAAPFRCVAVLPSQRAWGGGGARGGGVAAARPTGSCRKGARRTLSRLCDSTARNYGSLRAHLFFPSCSTYVLSSTRFTATLLLDGAAGVLTTPRSCFRSVLRADLEARPSSQHRFLDCDLCTPSSRSSASNPGSKNDSAGRIGSPPLPSLSFRLN